FDFLISARSASLNELSDGVEIRLTAFAKASAVEKPDPTSADFCCTSAASCRTSAGFCSTSVDFCCTSSAFCRGTTRPEPACGALAVCWGVRPGPDCDAL